MKYRQLRNIATGQWLDVLLTVDGDQFSVPELSHRTDIASAFGWPPSALEVVDADTDVRVGPMLALPLPPPRQPTAAELAQAKAVSDAADLVSAEVAKIIDARFPLNKVTAAEKAALSDRQVNVIAKAQGR